MEGYQPVFGLFIISAGLLATALLMLVVTLARRRERATTTESLMASAGAQGQAAAAPAAESFAGEPDEGAVEAEEEADDGEVEIEIETVPYRGIVARIGSCVVWESAIAETNHYVVLMEGSNEPFHAGSSEVLALTRPGDDIEFNLEVEPFPEEEGDTTPPRRYASDVVNHTLAGMGVSLD